LCAAQNCSQPLKLLAEYDWHGYVREHENVILSEPA